MEGIILQTGKPDPYPAFVSASNFLSFDLVEKRIYVSGLRDAAFLVEKKSGTAMFDKNRFTLLDTYVQLANEAVCRILEREGKTEELSMIAAATLIIEEWAKVAPAIKPTHAP